MARFLITAGIIILLAGIILYLMEKFQIKGLSWFGNLPGDIKIEKDNFKFYFPLVSMLIISLALSVIIHILKKIF
ncbi:MAG: DUF2905 domain-containing protein [Bacteroidia bacterium]|nr:DUF2905 domain-containing protein [Bacteroidia bacterium]